jgi:hypothetical protein
MTDMLLQRPLPTRRPAADPVFCMAAPRGAGRCRIAATYTDRTAVVAGLLAALDAVAPWALIDAFKLLRTDDEAMLLLRAVHPKLRDAGAAQEMAELIQAVPKFAAKIPAGERIVLGEVLAVRGRVLAPTPATLAPIFASLDARSITVRAAELEDGYSPAPRGELRLELGLPLELDAGRETVRDALLQAGMAGVVVQ